MKNDKKKDLILDVGEGLIDYSLESEPLQEALKNVIVAFTGAIVSTDVLKAIPVVKSVLAVRELMGNWSTYMLSKKVHGF